MILKVGIGASARPQGSKKAFVQNGRAILVESSKDFYKARIEFEQIISYEAHSTGWKRLAKDVPVKVELVFISVKPKSAAKRIWHTVKPDIDKQVRFCLDAITNANNVWMDDSQVVELVASKKYGEENQTWIEVNPLA